MKRRGPLTKQADEIVTFSYEKISDYMDLS